MHNKPVVIILGSSSPLGKAIVLELIAQKYHIYAASRSGSVQGLSGCTQVQFDITSDKVIERMVTHIVTKEKRIDYIINVVGITLSGPTLDYSVADFQTILDINVVGYFRLVKTLKQISAMPKKILNITSLNSLLALPNFGLYCASKFAVDALELSLRYELAPNTQLINIVPGALRSESVTKITHKTAREKIPFLNWMLPLTDQKDVARVVSKVLQSSHAPTRVLVGRDTKIIVFLQKVLPFALIDRLIFFYWTKK